MRTNLVRTAMVAVSCLLAVAVAEIVLHVANIAGPAKYAFNSTDQWRGGWFNEKQVAVSRTLGYEMRPNVRNINSLGMNGRERDPVKRDNVYRIVFLGDSVVNVSRLAPSLEKLLQQRAIRKTEVWDCSVTGYGTIQECNALLEKWIRYKPDQVIIGFCYNDFEVTPVLCSGPGGLTGYFLNDPTLKIIPFLWQHSALYRLVSGYFISRHMHDAERRRRIEKEVYGILERTKEKLASEKIPVLLVILPRPMPLEDNRQEPAFSSIRRITTQLGIATCDLSLLFGNRDAFSLRPEPNDDSHFTEEGGMIVADALADRLTKEMGPGTLR